MAGLFTADIENRGLVLDPRTKLFVMITLVVFALGGTCCNQRKKVIREYTQVGYFTLNLDDAKEYLYAKSTKRRILSWRDIHVNVFI